jgi:hypothetical protein
MTIDEAVAEWASQGVDWDRGHDLSALIEKWNGPPVTPAQAEAAIRVIVQGDDRPGGRYLSPDEEHATADAVLCALLRSLGCGQVVDEYLKLSRYFA